jgi:nucleotide-binding universal stress UspA family protein
MRRNGGGEKKIMAKRILAPIDAREHSERVVPIVAAMAREMGSTVRLLRVFPVPERVVDQYGRTVAYVDQEMERLTARGLDDLHPAEAALDGVPVETVVRFGDTADEILLEAEAFGADLIALTTSPRGRVQRLLAPDVAGRVARAASVPTLVLHG